jgi:N-acyl homoserine lactone hydrolase
MTELSYDVLISGFPARSSRGFLGWSTVTLIHTAAGPVLFDTGTQGDRVGLIAALAARGLAVDDIRLVILSHLHFDHVGNVECFPAAEVVLHQTELAYFHAQQGRDPALPIQQVETMLARSKLQLINGELDVVPDVRLLRTPGHTGGHCSLLFRSAGKSVVLAQDAIKHREEARSGNAAGAFDPALAARSIRRVLSMADIVVPGHDGALAIAGGKVVEASGGRVELTITTDGRTQRLEV